MLTRSRAPRLLQTGHHLIAVTEARKVGEIAGHEVFRVVATDVVPIGPPRPRLSAQQAEDDRTYVAMLREITGSGVFHFSYTYDLTRSQQAQAKQAASKDTPLYKRVRRDVPPPPGRKRGVLMNRLRGGADVSRTRPTSASFGTGTCSSRWWTRATRRPAPAYVGERGTRELLYADGPGRFAGDVDRGDSLRRSSCRWCTHVCCPNGGHPCPSAPVPSLTHLVRAHPCVCAFSLRGAPHHDQKGGVRLHSAHAPQLPPCRCVFRHFLHK